MNQLMVQAFGGVDAAKMYAQAARAAAASISDGDGLPILKCDKDSGEWTYGADKTLVGSAALAVDPLSFKHGYVAFKSDGSDVAETVDGDIADILRPITSRLPEYESLPELVASKNKRDAMPRWDRYMALELVLVDGRHKGERVVYKPTSRGGQKLAKMLFEEIGRRIEDGNLACVPVIELYSDGYTHKKRQNYIVTPECSILQWNELGDDTYLGKPKGRTAGRRDVDEPVNDRNAREALKAIDEEDEAPRKHPRDDERTNRGDLVDTRSKERGRDDDTDDKPRGRRASRHEEGDADDAARGRAGGRVAKRAAVDTDDRRGRDEDGEPARKRGVARRDDDRDTREDDRDSRKTASRDDEPRDRDRDERPAARARRDGDDDGGREKAPRDDDDGRDAPRGRRAAGGRRN